MDVNDGQRRAEQPQDEFTEAIEGVQRQLVWTLCLLAGYKHGDERVRALADTLVTRTSRYPREVLVMVLVDRLDSVARNVRSHGWDERDLEQLVARNAGPQHLAVLRAVLTEGLPNLLDSTERVASALVVAHLLDSAPLLSGSLGASRPANRSADHPKLAQVRALLAKAESTEFEAEAEALTAKAQELISRYSLEQLLAQVSDTRAPGGDLTLRRIWIDGPYVRAKVSLVHHVSLANRCRAAASASLGYSVVVGAPADLVAVEMLVTSLLVQADVAMLRQGSHVDRVGRSRTRAFRRSFLAAFAVRIGQRLEQASNDAAAAEDAGALLPALRDHRARVDDAFDATVPTTVRRSTAVTDGEGWSAGHAAADLAQLDVNDQLRERSGR